MTTTTSEALNQYPYQSVPNGGKYGASASYYGKTSTSADFDLDRDSGIRQLVFSAQSYYQSIRTTLNDAAGSIGPAATLAYPGILTRTLKAAMTALPNGNMKISTGGMTYSAQIVSRHTQWGLIKISCYTYLYVGINSLSAEFNPVSGAVVSSPPDLGISSNTQCDNNYSWVPFVGDFINTSAARLADGLIATRGASIGAMLDVQPQRALFGFVNALTANTYMLNGIDLGMFLKNNIAGLYAGRQMSLTIGDPAAVYAPTIRNTAGPTQYTGTAFGVMFSDNGIDTAGFKVDETRNFIWRQLVPDDQN